MGRVYIVGAGPGDPDLLTLKAYRILREAEAVLYDALVGEEVLEIVPPEAFRLFVGKRAGKHTLSQEEINRLLLELSRTYTKVVRLKGGDPFVFGRGGEELLFLLRHGVEVEVVPGVTSATAGPLSALIPVTHRGVSSSFAVISGHGKEVDWERISGADTLVVLMGVRRRREIAEELIRAGRDPSEPVAFVEKATTARKRVIFSTLDKVAKDPPLVGTPAVIVVGRVVDIGREALSYKHLISNLKHLSRFLLGNAGVEAQSVEGVPEDLPG
ncbi:MAG: uroporphyrinogen-III C-methyltransferase [Aquificota bacterium]|nr:uroporphyrinogen-III C-methyltransferase [Aquificota bacterium]